LQCHKLPGRVFEKEKENQSLMKSCFKDILFLIEKIIETTRSGISEKHIIDEYMNKKMLL